MSQQQPGFTLDNIIREHQRFDGYDKFVLGILRGLRALVYVTVMALAIPVEVLIHRKFGVRHLNLGTMVLGFVVMLALHALLVPLLIGEAAIVVGGVMVTAYVIAAVVHSALVWLRDRKGEPWHSRCSGLPYPFWKILPGGGNPFFVASVYEPALLLGLGVLISFASAYGAVLIAAGLALFFKRWIEAWQIRDQVLDKLDSEIEGAAISKFVED